MIMLSKINSYVLNYLEVIANYFDLKLKSNVNINDDVINIDVSSNNNSLLIGKYGKNLVSLEFILKEAIFVNFNKVFDVSIDVEGYKSKKIEQIDVQLNDVIEDVLNTKIDVKLNNLSDFEKNYVQKKLKVFSCLKLINLNHNCVLIKYKGK